MFSTTPNGPLPPASPPGAVLCAAGCAALDFVRLICLTTSLREPASCWLVSTIVLRFDTWSPAISTKISNSLSCAALAIVSLRGKFVFQYDERLRLLGSQLSGPYSSQPPPHEEFLNQRVTLRPDIRFRAGRDGDASPRPNRRRARIVAPSHPAASPFHFQSGFPAGVALPTGLVGKQKVEGDDQFFRSASLSPVSARTAAKASRNNSSGPQFASDSGVASLPSTSRPDMARNPQTKYSRSISARKSPASIFSQGSCAASRNSIRPASSRIRRINSSRRANDIRATVNATPGATRDSTTAT